MLFVEFFYGDTNIGLFLFSRFVEALPDKGEKLKNFQAQIKEELNKRVNAEQLCKDMVALNIGKDQLDTLEWTGKHVPCETSNHSQPDVNDEERDVLKMFVSHSGVNQDKIIIKYTHFMSFKVFKFLI